MDGPFTDVYVPGNFNRTFDGDVVVVRIITEEEAAKSFPKEKSTSNDRETAG